MRNCSASGVRRSSLPVYTCGGGACLPGAALNCDDSNPCTDDSCDPGTGCVHVNNTAPCSDGNACTTGDTCGGGSCQAGAGALNVDDNKIGTASSRERA